MLTDHVPPLACATSTPGTNRKASGMEVAPDRMMSSLVSTKTAAGASINFSDVLETDTTVASNSCSGERLKLSTFSAVCAYAGKLAILPKANSSNIVLHLHTQFVFTGEYRLGMVLKRQTFYQL